MERIIWLKSGQEVSYCPYCQAEDVWPTEVAGLWTCESCHRDFIARHRKSASLPQPRSMSSNEFWALLNKSREV